MQPKDDRKQPSWQFSLASPQLEPAIKITEDSLTATWSNVTPQISEDGKPWSHIGFKFIVTREMVASQDGVYPIAKAKITPVTGAKKPISNNQIEMNAQFSQPNWIGAMVNWTPGGVSIEAPSNLSHLPHDIIGQFVRLTSPVLDLSNGDRTYTLSFKAKVIGGSVPGKLVIFGYGEETISGLPETKEILLPNDNKVHEYNLTLRNGTWCHRIVLSLETAGVEVEFSDEISVKQSLKQGDTSYRSTYYQGFPYELATLLDPISVDSSKKDQYAARYTRGFGGLDPRALDLKAAETAGERIAYRMLYSEVRPGAGDSFSYRKSMYSAPSYLDNRPGDNQYVYLGYVGYEAPNYEILYPGSITSPSYHGGAIKVTKELLKNNIGDKVVGIRFATAASLQENQVNDQVSWYDIPCPFVFLAKTLKTSQEENSKSEVFLTKSPGRFKDGWNSVFFDTPYEITTESEFFAGAYAYDAASKGGIIVGSLDHTTNPDAVYIGSNWSTDTFDKAIFNNQIGYWDHPLLIQVIVEPKNANPQLQNKGELRGIQAPELLYSDQPLDLKISVYNSGVKSISNLDLDIEFNGKKESKHLELATGIQAGRTQMLDIKDIQHSGDTGRKTVKVTLLKVNNVAVASSSSLSAEINVLNREEAFDRTALVEIFTSEKCKMCPTADRWFEELLTDPTCKEQVDHMALVYHHSFFLPDFMAMNYSKALAPFYGIVEESGDIAFRAPSSPAMMINRTPNPALGESRATNSSMYSLVSSPGILKQAIDYATKTNPATVKATLQPYFNEATDTLSIRVEGLISARFDKSRPLYVTILLTQDVIEPRYQLYDGKPIEGFKHINVLRIVDDAGVQGTQVKIGENGFFTFEKKMKINSSDSKNNLPENTILLEGKNSTLAQAIKEVNVIAVLHNYAPLPTLDNVESNDVRLLQNEVLNVAQRRVSFTSFEGIEPATSELLKVYVAQNAIFANTEVANLEVYTLSGALVPSTNLHPGVYVVRVTKLDGRHASFKVLVP